jgi:hypothetical protein
MKRPMKCIVIALVGLLLIFADYAGASEYFPLKEGHSGTYVCESLRAGMKITYQAEWLVLPQKRLGDQLVIPVKNTMTTEGPEAKTRISYRFFRENDDGIRIAAKQDPGTFSPSFSQREEWELKFPLAVGGSWGRELDYVYANQKFVAPVTNTIEKMDDIVTVPAGKFEKCMKVKTYYSGKINLKSSGGNLELTVEGEGWYAPGIGLIKGCLRTKCDKPDLDGRESCMELKSFTNK